MSDLLTSEECAALARDMGWRLADGKAWNRTVIRHEALQAAREYLDGRTIRYRRADVEAWLATRRGSGRWAESRASTARSGRGAQNP